MSAYNKLWVVVVMMSANVARVHYGIDLGMSEEYATALVGGVTAFLVERIPNRA